MPNLLAKSDMHFIAELIFKADNSLRCNKTESPLHQLVLNAMNGQDILPLNSFLIPLFKTFSSQYLDCCYDNEGYNILHRAAMGGNIQTVKLMMTKGMNFSYPMRNDQNVLALCIYSSPFLKNGHVPSYYVSGPRFHILEFVFQSETVNKSIDRTRNVDFDSTADLLLNEMSRNVENTHETAAIEFTQLFGLCHMKRFANSIRKQLLLFHQEDGEFFFRYLQTRGMQTTEPLCDYEINELYQSVISRTYQDFKKLQVRRDLHKEWLHDIITEKIGIDFHVLGFFEFITKRLQITLKQSDNAMQFGAHHIMERINFAVSEFNDFGISLTHEETCVLVFNFYFANVIYNRLSAVIPENPFSV
ncbi:unnamed protein product [Mytilus edulis]|uniref:Uncharacterized protein n=1 Tax=Mytilus edulis TaxID=6550 RepID=A0A8S3Q1A1_MYTED|nr:unnamed protein product [Mytilus edulis]